MEGCRGFLLGLPISHVPPAPDKSRLHSVAKVIFLEPISNWAMPCLKPFSYIFLVRKKGFSRRTDEEMRFWQERRLAHLSLHLCWWARGYRTGEMGSAEPRSDLSLSVALTTPSRVPSLGSFHSEGTVGGPRPCLGKGDAHLQRRGHSDRLEWRGIQEVDVRWAGSETQDNKLCQGLGAQEGSLSSFRSTWCWTVPEQAL